MCELAGPSSDFCADSSGEEPDAARSKQVVYSLGIIDIFTSYTMKKKVEHFFKNMIHEKVSPGNIALALNSFI